MTATMWIGVAAAVVTVWLVILTVGALLCIRQLGALTARMEIVALGSGAGQGAALGFRISEDLARAHRGLSTGRRVVLVVSSTCTSCTELLQQVDRGDRPALASQLEGTIALLVGGDDPSRQQAQDILAGLTEDVVVDPLATAVAQALRMRTLPSALYLIDGIVAGTLMFVDRVEQIDDMIRGADLGAGTAYGNRNGSIAYLDGALEPPLVHAKGDDHEES